MNDKKLGKTYERISAQVEAIEVTKKNIKALPVYFNKHFVDTKSKNKAVYDCQCQREMVVIKGNEDQKIVGLRIGDIVTIGDGNKSRSVIKWNKSIFDKLHKPVLNEMSDK